MSDPRKKHIEIPLNGKLVTADPATIGTNFRTLTNMRYDDTHPKGISGNTKINTTALTTYLKTRSAFHFRKTQPAESHVLAQVYNTGLTASQIIDNTTAIPSAGDFSATVIHTDSTGAGKGFFSNAPDGQIVYSNGVDTCIWGGNEIKCQAFLTSTAAVTAGVLTNPKDFTEAVSNTKTDSDNVANIGGGVDAYTVMLIHANEADGTAGTSIIDSETTPKVLTAVGNAQVDTAFSIFGTGSVKFDGTGDYLTTPDHADFNFGTNPFTIDYWALQNYSVPGDTECGIMGQYQDANNYWYLKQMSSCAADLDYFNVYFKVAVGGVTKADYSWTSTGMAHENVWGWKHVALVRNGTSLVAYFHGVALTATVTTAIAANAMPDITGNIEIGACSNHTVLTNGWLDEFRVSKGIARFTANFSPPSTPYIEPALYFLVGSVRPLKGIKACVGIKNTIASTLTGSTWNGNSWETITITDNTDTTAGVVLSGTGTVVFDSMVTISQPKYLEGYFLYWYQFYLSAGEATISTITVDAPFQPLYDMWDGQYRDISAAYIRTTSLKDVSLNTYRDDFDVDTPDTYADLSSLAAFSSPENCLEIGFTEKITGLHFRLPPEYVNTTAATTMAVDYWDGAGYSTVGSISDGTMPADISFAQSGTVSWNNASIGNETKTNKMQSQVVGDVTNTAMPLYFYRVRWDKAMDASVRLNYIGGLTARKKISHYKFPIFAQGRILLCADMSEEKNKVTCSAKYMPQVYNGTDSVDILIGEEGELNCGVELFSQYGGNLYSLIMLFKDTETWVMAGQDIAQWGNNTFPISTTVGCTAPQTLQTINLVAEPGQGINRSLAIWQAANGIYMSDGRAPIPIHGDIKEYFDKNDTRCIRASKVGDSVSFIDIANQEYHWLFASGSDATTLNTELVYDIKRNRWFEINRGTGMDLQCGVPVVDTNGNQYAYGFIDTGYMERLEYGTTFDGNSIPQTFQFGDFAPLQNFYITQLDHLTLVMVGKTNTTENVTCTHYEDSNPTGSDYTLDPTPTTGYRIKRDSFDGKLQGTHHSLKFTITTNNETCGFEPLVLPVTFHALQEQ